MDRETLVNIVYSGKVRFIPVRRCSLCDEYIGYKFVKMYNGSIIPVFSSGCGCCGVNNGQLFERTWDEMLEFIDTIFGRKIDLDEDNQMIDIDISTMKVGDTYSFMNNQKEMVEIKAVKRSRLGCNGCYLSNSEILCKGCNKSERETNDNIMVVRIDKMDDVYRNDRPLDPEIGVVHSFRINNKIIKAVACQTVIRNDICSKCCFVDTNICSNMRCFSSVREDDKSVIFKKIEL